MNERIRLITRGDDAGSCRSATLAVLEAYRTGIEKNASIMVPAPEFEHAAELLAREPGLCIGLHSTVTAEWDDVRWGPVLPPERVPSLVDEHGHFFRTVHALGLRARPDELMAELEAQLQKAREHGLKPAYLDTHMAFRGIDTMLERLQAMARREGLVWGYEHPWLPRLDGAFETPVDAFIARLEAARDGTWLIAMHPGYDREDMQAFGRDIALQRDWDRRLFTDPRVIDYCAQHSVTAIPYTAA